VCVACNADAELELEVLAPLSAELQRRYGFKADLAHAAIVGVCRTCQQKAGRTD
jgi:Fe2+ or Zn2+ uptake regulation protein